MLHRFCAAAALTILTTPAWATPEPSPHRLYYQNLSAFTYNALGLINRTQAGYMYRLWGNPQPTAEDTLGDKIKQKSYLKAAFTNQLTPAFVRPGVLLEATPVALLRLAARVEGAAYFGTFNNVSSFDSPTATHDDDTLADDDAGYAITGWSARLDARLQFKVGPIAARSELRAEYFDFGINAEDSVFYDTVADTLVPNRGWSLTAESDVLYFANDRLILGARHTMIRALYEDADYRPSEDPATARTNTPLHRAGPIFVYRLDPTATGGRFNEPTVFLITQWWLEHRYRTGEVRSQALPYLAIGFAFNGDL